MSSFLPQVLPQDVLDYILPILSSLAIDEDETVKEALSAELVHVIWWVLTHYRVVREDGCHPIVSDETNSDVLPICAQAFTPILGTLLLSVNGNVGSNARSAIVGVLRRIKRLDDIEDGADPTQVVDKGGGTNISADPWVDGFDDFDLTPGLFEWTQRRLFEEELLNQVVIGMARLDMHEEEPPQPAGTPYFDAPQPSTPYFDRTPYYDALQSPEVLINPASARDSYFPAVITGSYEMSDSGNPQGEDSTSRLTPTQPHLAWNSPQSVSDDSTPELSPSGLTPSINSAANRNNSTSPASSSDSDKPPPAPERPDMDNTMSGVTIYEGDDWRSRHDQNWAPPQEFEESPQSPVGSYPWMSESVIFAPESKQEDTSGCPVAGITSLGDCHEGGVEDEEQAALGRLSSMSLMAAVTASGKFLAFEPLRSLLSCCLVGPLSQEMKLAFVKEVERVAGDPIYWVRREASYTLGALAKVIPAEIVVSSLVSMGVSRQTRESPNVGASPHSCPYSRPCVRTKSGMFGTPHSLHSLRRWPDCHQISVGPLRSALSCLFRKIVRRTCGPLSWKPLERSCTLSMKTRTVCLQSFLNFSWVASRTQSLALARRFLPHPAGRAATRIGRTIILHGPWSLLRSLERKRKRMVWISGMTRHVP